MGKYDPDRVFKVIDHILPLNFGIKIDCYS